MIYTVTFNPSLDYVVSVKDFQIGIVNRTEKEQIFAGGKGLNVSVVLKNLGIDSVALGFIAGFTGCQIEQGIKEKGVTTDFIHIEHGLSRINIKLKSEKESEINGQGPDIPEKDLNILFEQLGTLQKGDILILAGSIPNTLPEDIYEKILAGLEKKEISVIVDATKDLLLNVLKYRPFLIKPNNHELGEMFGIELKSTEEIIFYARKLQEKGARNVLISMAGDGAVFVGENGEVYESAAPKGIVVNSVGAGDSMVAGFVTGYLESKDMGHAFKMGVATGSAAAFSSFLASKPDVLALLKTIE